MEINSMKWVLWSCAKLCITFDWFSPTRQTFCLQIRPNEWFQMKGSAMLNVHSSIVVCCMKCNLGLSAKDISMSRSPSLPPLIWGQAGNSNVNMHYIYSYWPSEDFLGPLTLCVAMHWKRFPCSHTSVAGCLVMNAVSLWFCVNEVGFFLSVSFYFVQWLQMVLQYIWNKIMITEAVSCYVCMHCTQQFEETVICQYHIAVLCCVSCWDSWLKSLYKGGVFPCYSFLVLRCIHCYDCGLSCLMTVDIPWKEMWLWNCLHPRKLL